MAYEVVTSLFTSECHFTQKRPFCFIWGLEQRTMFILGSLESLYYYIRLLISCNWTFLARSANLPTGLCILLALISSFYFFLFYFCYEQSYLSIYWTDFHDLFTKWKIFAWIYLIRSIFSDSSRDVAMATNFVWCRTCSLGAKVSQDPLDRFSQSLHHMVGIELQMIVSFYFFWYLKGRRHGNQFSGKNGAKLPTPPAFITVSIQNGMGYRYLNGRVNSPSDVSISCKNFVNFGSVTPEKTGLICILFLRHGKKLAYLVKYLRIYWTNFYNLLTIWKRFADRWYTCTLFFNLSRDIAMAINFFWENIMNADWYHLHSLHYCLKTSCNITI